MRVRRNEANVAGVGGWMGGGGEGVGGGGGGRCSCVAQCGGREGKV